MILIKHTLFILKYFWYSFNPSEESNSLLNTVMNLVLDFENTSKLVPLNALNGEVSDDVYYMADVSSDDSINQTTYIARMNYLNNITWSWLYDYKARRDFAVAPNENYFFGTVEEQYPTFIQFDTKNGKMMQLMSFKSLSDSETSKIVVSPGSGVLFIILKGLNEDPYKLWRWNVQDKDTYIKCRDLSKSSVAVSITPLSDSSIFSTYSDYNAISNPKADANMIKFDFFESIDTWALKIPCQYDNWELSNSEAIFDYTHDRIYNLASYQQDILFFALNTTGNEVVNSKYLWNDYSKCIRGIKLQKQGVMIYAVYYCNGYTAISVFNTTQETFLVSYRTYSELSNLTFSSVQAFIADTQNNNPRIVIKRAPVRSINSFYGLDVGDFFMVHSSDTRSYSIERDISNNYSPVNIEGEDYKVIAENTAIIAETITNDTESDIEFHLEPINLGGVLNNNRYNSQINYTWSRSGVQQIQYSIGNLSPYPAPEWIKADPENGEISLNIPYFPVDRSFFFTLNAEIGSSNRKFSRPATISVRIWNIEGWMKWDKESETCSTCIGKH
jgi:hypothetical protein